MLKSERMDEFPTCFICGRFPLIGEEVTAMANGTRETLVCDPCAANPRADGLGEAIGRERIRSREGAATVRRLFPTPAPAGSPRPSPAVS